MSHWLRYLIAFVIFCHGFVYLRVGPLAVNQKEWRGTSWLLGETITGGNLKMLVVTLDVLAGIVTIGCALAVGVAPSLPGWWRPLMLGSAILGIAVFAAFWDGQTQRLFEEGAVGVAISLTLLIIALAFPQAF